MLPNLLTLHPHLSVQLVRITSVEDFFSRQVDCALLPGDVVGATLAGRELRPGRIVLVASPDYLARHGRPEQPSDLQRHACITLVQHDGHEQPWFFKSDNGGDESRSVRVRGVIRTDDLEQVMAAAVAGLGIAWVPHLPLQAAIADGPDGGADAGTGDCRRGSLGRLSGAPGIAAPGTRLRRFPAGAAPRPSPGQKEKRLARQSAHLSAAPMRAAASDKKRVEQRRVGLPQCR